MAKQVFIAPEAAEQLREIEEYIAELSGYPEIAENYLRRLVQFIDGIGDSPRSGRSMTVAEQVFQVRVFETRYRVLYQDLPHQVRVVNVHRTSRDWRAVARILRGI